VADAGRLQQALRVMAAPGRTVVLVPPFTLFLHLSDPMRFLNYAIPDAPVAPDAAAIEALRAAFRRHNRLPRLEWVEEAAPCLARALTNAGMQEELRTPLMACEPHELVSADASVESLVVAPVVDEELRELADLQRAAFGQPSLAPDAEPSDPRRGGGGAVLARVAGVPAAAAAWTAPVDGVTEIVGVATGEAWRRRGLAGTVTAAAGRGAFAAGASVCILSPGGETAQRVYERAGFHRVATMLHYSDSE